MRIASPTAARVGEPAKTARSARAAFARPPARQGTRPATAGVSTSRPTTSIAAPARPSAPRPRAVPKEAASACLRLPTAAANAPTWPPTSSTAAGAAWSVRPTNCARRAVAWAAALRASAPAETPVSTSTTTGSTAVAAPLSAGGTRTAWAANASPPACWARSNALGCVSTRRATTSTAAGAGRVARGPSCVPVAPAFVHRVLPSATAPAPTSGPTTSTVASVRNSARSARRARRGCASAPEPSPPAATAAWIWTRTPTIAANATWSAPRERFARGGCAPTSAARASPCVTGRASA